MRYIVLVACWIMPVTVLWIFVVNLVPNEKFWDPYDEKTGTRVVVRDFVITVGQDIEAGIIDTIDKTYEIKVSDTDKVLLFTWSTVKRMGMWTVKAITGGYFESAKST